MTIKLAGGVGSAAREFRGADSTDNYVSDACTNQQYTRWCRLQPGQNGVNDFQYYSAAAAPANDVITPLVFWGPEATFLQNIVAMSTLTTSYATYGTGGNAPAGLAAVFSIHGTNDYDVYFRHPSSTDAFDNGNEGVARRDWFCALNGTQQYAAKAGNAGRQPYLVCYFTSNVVVPANGIAVTRTPGTAGSYQNLSTSGDTNPIGAAYYLHSPSTGYAYQLSAQGTSWSAPNVVPGGGYSGGDVAYTPAQVNIANLALVVSELAYFTAGAGANAIAWVT
jgi:hypothetical protein